MNEIGCIILASGLSVRYGKNKLLEKLGDCEVILHTVSHAFSAGLSPLTVTRSDEVKCLLEEKGFPCILHSRPLKSDTMHIGIENLETGKAGFLFMQGDQPMVLPETLERLVREFLRSPYWAVRLGYDGVSASPVIFPAGMREALLSYQGDRGGMEMLKSRGLVCNSVEASYEWELWDVDTPERMERARKVYSEAWKAAVACCRREITNGVNLKD